MPCMTIVVDSSNQTDLLSTVTNSVFVLQTKVFVLYLSKMVVPLSTPSPLPPRPDRMGHTTELVKSRGAAASTEFVMMTTE